MNIRHTSRGVTPTSGVLANVVLLTMNIRHTPRGVTPPSEAGVLANVVLLTMNTRHTPRGVTPTPFLARLILKSSTNGRVLANVVLLFWTLVIPLRGSPPNKMPFGHPEMRCISKRSFTFLDTCHTPVGVTPPSGVAFC